MKMCPNRPFTLLPFANKEKDSLFSLIYRKIDPRLSLFYLKKKTVLNEDTWCITFLYEGRKHLVSY